MEEVRLVEKKKNYFAIAGLALLFVEPVIGLIFAIIGIDKSKTINGAGKIMGFVTIGLFVFGVLFDIILDLLIYVLADLLMFFV